MTDFDNYINNNSGTFPRREPYERFNNRGNES